MMGMLFMFAVIEKPRQVIVERTLLANGLTGLADFGEDSTLVPSAMVGDIKKLPAVGWPLPLPPAMKQLLNLL